MKVLTTPLLSTISWIIRPFFPITLPTRFRGTCKDSSLYSSIVLAFFTASLVCKVINHSFRIKLKLQFCLQTFIILEDLISIRSYIKKLIPTKFDIKAFIPRHSLYLLKACMRGSYHHLQIISLTVGLNLIQTIVLFRSFYYFYLFI